MIIDAHSHLVPEKIIDLVLGNKEMFGVTLKKINHQEYLSHKEGLMYPLKVRI